MRSRSPSPPSALSLSPACQLCSPVRPSALPTARALTPHSPLKVSSTKPQPRPPHRCHPRGLSPIAFPRSVHPCHRHVSPPPPLPPRGHQTLPHQATLPPFRAGVATTRRPIRSALLAHTHQHRIRSAPLRTLAALAQRLPRERPTGPPHATNRSSRARAKAQMPRRRCLEGVDECGAQLVVGGRQQRR